MAAENSSDLMKLNFLTKNAKGVAVSTETQHWLAL
jgi:hypothetical protein